MNQTDMETNSEQQPEDFLEEERRAFWFFIKVYLAVVITLVIFGGCLSK